MGRFVSREQARSLARAEVYTSREDTPEGPRWWAEVVTDAGEEREVVHYASAFYAGEAEALGDAHAWLRRMTD